MYRLMRGVGFRMDPEQAHRWALRLARMRGAMWWGSPIDAVSVDLFGLRFPNRVGLAAGYDKDAIALRGLAAYGFGHLEVGTVTPRPQAGHPTPRMWRYPERRALINRMGFPSAGADAVARRLAGWRRTAIIGVSIGPNADTDPARRLADYESLVRSLAPHCDYLAINVSSPNTEGLRDLQNEVGRVVAACLGARTTDTPIVVKLSPDLDEPGEVARAAEAAGAHGLIVSNTTVARPGFAETTPPGGLSGAPLAALALENLERVRAATTIPLIASGGIMSVADARRRLEAGASLVQLYTGLVYEGPRLVRRIARDLWAYHRRMDHHDLLRHYFDRVWGDGDPEAVREFASPSYRRHVSPGAPPLDLEAQIARLQGIRAAFPDIEIDLVDAVAEDDRIAFRSVLRGTHRGPLMGLPPTGREVEVHLVDIIRIEEGHIVEQWGGPDMLDLLRQIGATVRP